MNRYISLLIVLFSVCASTLEGSHATAAAGTADTKSAGADANDRKQTFEQQMNDLKIKQDIAAVYKNELAYLQTFFGEDMRVKPHFIKFLVGAHDLDVTALYGPYKRSLLMGLVAYGDIKLVTRCLQRGAKVNQKDVYNATALNYALAHCVNPQITYALIQADAMIDHVHSLGLTPLMDCCNTDATLMSGQHAHNQRMNLDLLLTALMKKDKALINATGHPASRAGALNFAIGSLQDMSVEKLLAHGADFHSSEALTQVRNLQTMIEQNNTVTPEHKAAKQKKINAIFTLLKNADRAFNKKHDIVAVHDIDPAPGRAPFIAQWRDYFNRLEAMKVNEEDAQALKEHSENYRATVKAFALVKFKSKEKSRARHQCVAFLKKHKDLTAQQAAKKQAQSDAKSAAK